MVTRTIVPLPGLAHYQTFHTQYSYGLGNLYCKARFIAPAMNKPEKIQWTVLRKRLKPRPVPKQRLLTRVLLSLFLELIETRVTEFWLCSAYSGGVWYPFFFLFFFGRLGASWQLSIFPRNCRTPFAGPTREHDQTRNSCNTNEKSEEFDIDTFRLWRNSIANCTNEA